MKYCFQYLFSISLIFVIMDICHLWQTTQWECLPRTLVRVVFVFFPLPFHHLASFLSFFVFSLSHFHSLCQVSKILSFFKSREMSFPVCGKGAKIDMLFSQRASWHCVHPAILQEKLFLSRFQGNAEIEWKANLKSRYTNIKKSTRGLVYLLRIGAAFVKVLAKFLSCCETRIHHFAWLMVAKST